MEEELKGAINTGPLIRSDEAFYRTLEVKARETFASVYSFLKGEKKKGAVPRMSIYLYKALPVETIFEDFYIAFSGEHFEHSTLVCHGMEPVDKDYPANTFCRNCPLDSANICEHPKTK